MNNPLSIATLGDLVTLQTDKIVVNKDPRLPYIGLEHIAQGSPRLLGIADSGSSVSTNSVFAKNDILFGKLRPNLRKSLRAAFAGYCSTDILVLRCIEGVDPAFAGHVFQWEPVFAAASATAAGTKMPRTSWNELRGFRVFKPSTAEQSRIAAVLDTVDEAIAKTEAVIAKLKQVRAGLLHDLLTRGLDENGQLRDPVAHPEQFQDSPIGRIPRGWLIVPLQNCCEAIVDCPHSTPEYLDKGILVARTMHIKNAKFDTANASRVTEEEYKARITRLKPKFGDVIFTREAPVGEAFVIPDGITICLGQRVMLFRPIDNFLLGIYLVAHIYFGILSEMIKKLTGGTTNPHLNVADVRGLSLPIPSFNEQRAISKNISSLEAQLESEEANLEKLKLLKSALMADLLTGRVRVPADLGFG